MFMTLIIALILTITASTAAASLPKIEADADGYVGSQACAGCHQDQYQLWRDSHHDWAMKPATQESVLGDFNDSEFNHYGEKTRFTQSSEGFFVTTDNAEGEQQTFKVAYTFGFYPLQQYLLPTGDGRLQALSVSWDSRPREEGGQRWFHLYPNEAIPSNDTLHWTGPYQNWNNRCADCHSTNLKRGFDSKTDSYNTTWSEINVACESCHGPGKRHVEWTGTEQISSISAPAHAGFKSDLSPVTQWLRTQDQATASPASPTQTTHPQLDVCGSCHARRSLIDTPTEPTAFHQRHGLSLLQEPLYHGDGQIRDEVYVLGSFAQSKMHERGVVCSNCHEPHSLQLRAEGNAVCAQCHNPEVFDQPQHHHHPNDSSGAQCINCHMPETTYMVVDPRRDHSLRIPRPDLSEEFGVPNACNQCHTNRDASWASSALQNWLKASGKQLQSFYSEALLRGLRGGSDSQQRLMSLAMENRAPNIVQASALAGLDGITSASHLLVAQTQLHHASPSVRTAAVRLLAGLPAAQRYTELRELIQDDSKQVRMAVASALSSMDPAQLSDSDLSQWRTLLKEYEASLLLQQDTPSGQVALGVFYAARGAHQKAQGFYRKALQQAPELLIASLNLADLHRELQREDQVMAVLNQALTHAPEAAALHHTRGLSLVRQKQYKNAEPALAKAAALAPDNVRYGYIYGVILHHRGKLKAAQEQWHTVLQLDPQNSELLVALLGVSRERQDWPMALNYARRLQSLQPNDQRLQSLIAYLQQRVQSEASQ